MTELRLRLTEQEESILNRAVAARSEKEGKRVYNTEVVRELITEHLTSGTTSGFPPEDATGEMWREWMDRVVMPKYEAALARDRERLDNASRVLQLLKKTDSKGPARLNAVIIPKREQPAQPASKPSEVAANKPFYAVKENRPTAYASVLGLLKESPGPKAEEICRTLGWDYDRDHWSNFRKWQTDHHPQAIMLDGIKSQARYYRNAEYAELKLKQTLSEETPGV